MKSTSFSRFVAIGGLGAVAAVALSGCFRPHHIHHAHAGRPLVVGAQLNCPPSQGLLTRATVSTDGNTCEYHRSDGEQVILTRLPLNGQNPQAALDPIEASLKALLPPRKESAAVSDDKTSTDKDSAHIDVPGVHIDAHDNKAEVRVFGVTINADNDKANVQAGLGSDKAVVSADESGAEVRANDVDATNANLVLILASEKPGPTGFRAVGYIARGPASGPLVVAEFKSVQHHSGINDDHDIRRLMDLNISR
jgi:hypothetical protein